MSKQSDGGRARADSLSPDRRREIAASAARKRWGLNPAKQLVYVIGPEVGPQKIGIAMAPDLRVRELQSGNPAKLHIALTLDTGEHLAAKVERRAHWILKDRHLSGEWFDVAQSEAAAAVKQALSDVQNGIETPLKPQNHAESRVRSIRLPDELWADLDEEAERRGISMNRLIKDFIALDAAALAANPEQIPKPLKAKAKPAEKAAPVKSAENPPKVSLSLPSGAKLVDPKR